MAQNLSAPPASPTSVLFLNCCASSLRSPAITGALQGLALCSCQSDQGESMSLQTQSSLIVSLPGLERQYRKKTERSRITLLNPNQAAQVFLSSVPT